MEIIDTRTPVARVKHTCDFCGTAIEKGTKYQYSINKYEGGLYSWKSHLSCIKLADVLNMEGSGEGITQEDFIEYVNNAYDFLDLKGAHSFKGRLDIVKDRFEITSE